MTDYISRQEAIDVLNRFYDEYVTEEEDKLLETATKLLEAIPSADVREVKELPDGTLSIKVDDALKVGRVLVHDDNHWGSLYYADGSIPKGEWLCSDDMYEMAICSNCNYDTHEPVDYVRTNYHFCSNCGADMRGGNDGN